MSTTDYNVDTIAQSVGQVEGSNALGNTQETQNTRKSHVFRSIVWDYFDILPESSDETRKANCMYCGTTISCSTVNGTSSMRNHLKRCPTSHMYQPSKRLKVVEPKSPVHVFDQARCSRALVVYIIVDELPFSHVEKEGFIGFCKELQPNFVIPKRKAITQDCYELFLSEKKKLREYFGTLNSSVSFTTDLWSSNQNIDYLCLTAHFIDDAWTLHKRVINFCPIADHTGDLLGKTIQKCLLDWGIKRVLTVTVDNASSNDKCITYLRDSLKNWRGSVLNCDHLHLRCATHILNLIVKEGFKDYNNHISRIRAAVKYVKSSAARTRHFKSHQELQGLNTKAGPSLDVETRWNATYTMLKSALKFRSVFDALALDDKYLAEMGDKVPLDFDWEYAQNLLPFLKVFYDTTVRLSGSSYVTGNEYILQISGVRLVLSAMENSSSMDLKSMASSMQRKFDKYWTNFDKMNILIFIACILDPRYKQTHVDWVIEKTYGSKADDLKKDVDTTLRKMYELYIPAVSSNRNTTSTSLGFDVIDVHSDTIIGAAAFLNSLYVKEQNQLSNLADKTELDRYLVDLKADPNDTSFDILKWWKSNASRYPTIALMARDVLAIPVTTVASESAFSTGGRILDSFRSSLSPRMVEAVICGQDWLRKNRDPIIVDDYLDELEEIEAGIARLNERHPIIDVE